MAILETVNNFIARRGRIFKRIAKSFAGFLIFCIGRISGFKVLPEAVIGSFQMLFGIWEPGTVALMRSALRPGMVAVDIGGHVGYFTRIFARAVGPRGAVHVFEPHPVNFSYLKENTKRFPNVVLIRKAATNKNGAVTFYESSAGSGSHSIFSGRYHASREIHVEGVSLDSQFGDMHIDFMKIDVEGAEHEVLEGGKKLFSRANAPVLVVEFAPKVILSRGLDPKIMLAKLREFGYAIFSIDEEKKKKIPLSAWLNDDAFVASVKKYANLFCVK